MAKTSEFTISRKISSSQMIVLGLAVLALVSLLSSLVFGILSVTGLNKPLVQSQPGQLLNQQAVEQAKQLLEEKTVVFEIE